MIGIFDSGVGGLTVASAIYKRAPRADFVYFGDLANAPFGPKSTDELFGITIRAIRFLRAQGATEIIAACNSVSVSVIRPMMEVFGIQGTHMIEMVEPAARALVKLQPKKILVIATEATVRSGIYSNAFSEHGLITEMMAIPKLATAIEEGKSAEFIEQIILPAVDRVIAIGADTLVFGCTHYPFTQSIFEKLFAERGYSIRLFDPSLAVAEETILKFDVEGSGLQRFYVSKPSSVFNDTIRSLFGDSVTVEDVNNTLLD